MHFCGVKWYVTEKALKPVENIIFSSSPSCHSKKKTIRENFHRNIWKDVYMEKIVYIETWNYLHEKMFMQKHPDFRIFIKSHLIIEFQ